MMYNVKASVKKRITDRKRKTNVIKNKSQSAKKKPVVVRSGKPVGGNKKRVGTSRKPTDVMKRNVKRDANGCIIAGSGSNGGGRPTGSTSTARVEELQASISRVELERVPTEKGKGRNKTKARGKWLDHQIRKSYEDTSLAIAILSRLYPSLKAVEQVTLSADMYSPEEMIIIRKEYHERFG